MAFWMWLSLLFNRSTTSILNFFSLLTSLVYILILYGLFAGLYLFRHGWHSCHSVPSFGILSYLQQWASKAAFKVMILPWDIFQAMWNFLSCSPRLTGVSFAYPDEFPVFQADDHANCSEVNFVPENRYLDSLWWDRSSSFNFR